MIKDFEHGAQIYNVKVKNDIILVEYLKQSENTWNCDPGEIYPKISKQSNQPS